MPATIITTEDLEQLKEDLLFEIKELLTKNNRIKLDKWIKSHELMSKLGISPGTLQNLRINQTIPFTKIGGIIYYNEEEIDAILKENKNFLLKTNL